MLKQVNKEEYQFASYVDKRRWMSYYYQLKEVISLNPGSVLEIGIGDKVFSSYLKNNTNIVYKSLDIAEDLEPDVLSSVEKIPLEDNSIDLVCAFQILEHLPFDKFEQSLYEMRRVSKKFIVISLPHIGANVRVLFKMLFLPEISLALKSRYIKKHQMNWEHYWEIGTKEHDVKLIKSILQKLFIIRKDFIPFENQFHHFYVLEKVC